MNIRIELTLLAIAFGLIPTATAQNFRLPLDCPAVGCAIQNYADVDAGSGAADPSCGGRTYDGHNGLDFRVPGAAARSDVEVLAPAGGVVTAIRDGQSDGAYLSGGRTAVAGYECGNGITVEHSDGWSSQLCHMRRNSIRVKPGEKVDAGRVIGLVGLSGFTQFPHVHLTLRKDGVIVEPLSGAPLGSAACHAGSLIVGPQWSPLMSASLGNKDTQWFEFGFAGKEPKQDPSMLEPDTGRHAPALLFWALAIGPHTGDTLRVTLSSPDGTILAQAERRQERDQAQAWLYTGRPTPTAGWPAGLYSAEAILIREGRVFDRREAELRLVR